MSCNAGYGDCNRDPSDGCERATNTDLDCGGCGITCRGGVPGGLHTCSGRACSLSCLRGYDDCNADESDGCETYIDYNSANCGGCGIRCSGSHPNCCEGSCSMFACAIK